MTPRVRQQHVEYSLINAVVRPVDGGHPDFGGWLAEPIGPTLSLFEPSGVPWEVVVGYGIEERLEIDALRKAVRSHQHPSRLIFKLCDPPLPLFGGQAAGD